MTQILELSDGHFRVTFVLKDLQENVGMVDKESANKWELQVLICIRS